MATDNTIPVPSATGGTLSAAVKIGGAFPYAWKLWDHSQQNGAWQVHFVGSGQGQTAIPVGTIAALNGHVLHWQVALSNYDNTSSEADVRPSLADINGKQYPTQGLGTWDVTPTTSGADIYATVKAV
jgi:hypothetical protein